MKTLTLLIASFAALLSASAQTSLSESTERAMAFSTDEMVHSKPSENQRNIRSSSAFNGWMYAAYTINDTSSSKGGIYVAFSKDNGLSWKKFVTYQFGNSYYPVTDILVTGTDTSNLNVFVAGVLKNTLTSKYSIYMDKFDGRNGNLLAGQVYTNSLNGSQISDLALASDYLSPAGASSPYNVSLLYAIHNNSRDSLLVVSSINAGQNFSPAKTIYTTAHFIHKVSFAYGKSASNPAGMYFAAWDVMASPAAKLGHIYTSRALLGNSPVWQVPFCLDSGSASLNNKLRNPSIACQYNTAKNDSNGLSVIIAYEKQSGNLMGISGSYNKKACTSQNWTPFSISSAGENDLTPNTVFDPSTNNFLLTYMDSTNGRLPFAFEGFNMDSPNSWAFSSMQYNDQTSQVKMANPHIVFNLKMALPGFVWINEGNGNQNGVAMFDAAYANLITGLGSSIAKSDMHLNPWPNPASSSIQIPINDLPEAQIAIVLYDILGNEVFSEVRSTAIAAEPLNLDIAGFPNGIYFIHTVTGKAEQVFRFVIQH